MVEIQYKTAAVGVKKKLKYPQPPGWRGCREIGGLADLLEALLLGLLFFSYIRLLDSGGRERRGRVLPCRAGGGGG